MTGLDTKYRPTETCGNKKSHGNTITISLSVTWKLHSFDAPECINWQNLTTFPCVTYRQDLSILQLPINQP